MQRVAGMSVVVRADGVSEAFYNGQRDRVVEAVRAEAEGRVKQAEDRAERERRRAEDQARKCNRMRRRSMCAIAAKMDRKRGILGRIEDAWAYAWATAGAALMTAWIWLWVALYGLKLVAYDGEVGKGESDQR